MGALYDMSQTLMREIQTRYTDPMELVRAKGEAARQAGFMVSMVSASDPDDPQKIAGIRNAARQLGITL